MCHWVNLHKMQLLLASIAIHFLFFPGGGVLRTRGHRLGFFSTPASTLMWHSSLRSPPSSSTTHFGDGLVLERPEGYAPLDECLACPLSVPSCSSKCVSCHLTNQTCKSCSSAVCLTESSSSSTAPDHTMAVLVLSRRDVFETRQVIRETWANDHTNVFFVLGTCCPIPPSFRKQWTCSQDRVPSEKEQKTWDAQCQTMDKRLSEEQAGHGDLIRIEEVDVYRHLPHKLKNAYAWAVEHTSAKWFVKIDMDSVVRVDTLEHYLTTTYDASKPVLISAGINKASGVPSGGKWAEFPHINKLYTKYPPWPNGAGHVVSLPIAKYIAMQEDLLFAQGEDVSLGIWIDRSPLKVTFKTSKHFIPHSGDCKNKNAWVIGHDITAAKMRDCFKHMDEAEESMAAPVPKDYSPLVLSSHRGHRNKGTPPCRLSVTGYSSIAEKRFLDRLFPECLKSVPLEAATRLPGVTDILMVGMHGPISGDIDAFQGPILYLNGEPPSRGQEMSGPRDHYLGPTLVADAHHMQFYYASFAATVSWSRFVKRALQDQSRFGFRKRCVSFEVPECNDMGFPWSDSNRESNWMRSRLDSSLIGSLKGLVVVDVGANTGRDAEVYLQRGAKSLLLFEPIAANVAILRDKFKENPKVKVFPYALGSAERRSFLNMDGDSGEGSYEVLDGEVSIEVRDVVSVFQQTIHDNDRVFLSLNCEGCEFELLGRLAAHANGAYLRNGTVQTINMAFHLDRGKRLPSASTYYCTALEILQIHWTQMYCSGPWMAWQWTPRQPNFLVYTQRRCIQYRETAFDRIIDHMHTHSLVSIAAATGRCFGSHPELHKKDNGGWTTNSAYRPYRFVLAMENQDAPGYVTEKLLNVFLSQSIPIYYGTTEVFKLFNKDAFIYYDIHDPQAALDRILYLETNRSAYAEVLAQPMLAEGALEEYFSLSDDVGGGKLKQRIRDMVLRKAVDSSRTPGLLQDTSDIHPGPLLGSRFPTLNAMVGTFPSDRVESVVINIGSSHEPLPPPINGLALVLEPISHEEAAKVAKANDARIQGGRSIVVPAAVAANASFATMRVYNKNGVSSSLALPKNAHASWASNAARNDGRTVEVPVLRMAEVMDWIPSSIPISLLKTDMQGFDYESLSSLPRSELARPASIQSEVYLAGVSSYKGVHNDFCKHWLPFLRKNQCTVQRIREQCVGKTLDGAKVDDFCLLGGTRLGTCEADMFWSCDHDLASRPALQHGHGNYHLDYPNGMHQPLSWSQYGQDRHIADFFNGKRGLFFVEIGGYDGEKFSNTLLLEKELGWDGLLVESNPYTYALLKQRDRNCWFSNACISNELPTMTFVVSGSTTSAKETMSANMRTRIQHDVVTYGKSGDKRWVHAGEEVIVHCRSMESMMTEIGREHIDYFSLDVEGAEMLILESIPFDRLTIDVFTIEMDQHSEEIEAFMASKNYTKNYSLRGDAVFVSHT